MKTTIKLSDIKLDRKFYPRDSLNPFIVGDYARSMKLGEKFPPIEVVKKGKYYSLIDGWHRVSAARQAGFKTIQSIILSGLTEAELFAIAVQKNIKHGQRLTNLERAKCIVRLQKLGFDDMHIAKIVSIPMGKIQNYVGKRIAIIADSRTGKPYEYDVKPLVRKQFFASSDEVKDKIADTKIFGGHSAEVLLDDLIYILENKLLKKSKSVMWRIKALHKLLHKL